MEIGQSTFYLFNIKINQLTGNASINLGENKNSEFSFSSNDHGSHTTIGDSSPSLAHIENEVSALDSKEKSS